MVIVYIKLKLYSRRGAQEYWVVDWQQRRIELYRRSDGVLVLEKTLDETDTLHTPLLLGFSCKVSHIFTGFQLLLCQVALPGLSFRKKLWDIFEFLWQVCMLSTRFIKGPIKKASGDHLTLAPYHSISHGILKLFGRKFTLTCCQCHGFSLSCSTTPLSHNGTPL